MAEWKRVRLDEACAIFAGGDAPKDTSKSITDSCSIPVYSNGITNEGLYGYTAKARVNVPAITISARGTIGVVFYRRTSFFPIVRLITVLPKTSDLDVRFLYYRLLSVSFIGDGSAVKQLTVPMISEYEIDVPSFQNQKKIAAVLGAIDDKIETNRKICANLEAQAQALFKSWFVDFEPFGGKMPNKWNQCVLEDVTENIRTRVGRENREVLSAVAEGKLVLSEEYFTKQVFSKSIAKYIIVDEWDFAYNPARINIGSIGVNDLGISGCVSPVYVSFRVDKDYRQYFSMFFKTSYFGDQVKMRANGSVRQILTYDDFGKIPCLCPDRITIHDFNKIHDSVYSAIKHHKDESRALASMRDALLPKLMSGEIDVEKVEVA